ncbi:hypothetical protein NPIL_366241 [Nephila pilipes]|uniref:Uncharacterized protein n=1 Tax=Nephila pilipes TaxID=299642 RepID=A0A8X6MYZ1_NEPPI|nr:hypothetical protein NPIL_366241 [Nephila pilipes]
MSHSSVSPLINTAYECGFDVKTDPAAIVDRPNERQRGIMVRSAIAYDSRLPPVSIPNARGRSTLIDIVLLIEVVVNSKRRTGSLNRNTSEQRHSNNSVICT